MSKSKWFVAGSALVFVASSWAFAMGHWTGSSGFDQAQARIAGLERQLAAQADLTQTDLGHLIATVQELSAKTDASPTLDALTRTEALLAATLEEMSEMEREIALLQEQLAHGFVQLRTVDVTQAKLAYPLVPPKLMMSVDALKGGRVTAHFGTESASFMVGERVDFALGPCDCFLVLMESRPGRAEFAFGCEEVEVDGGTPLSAPL